MIIRYNNVPPHYGLAGTYLSVKPNSETWKLLPDVRGFPVVVHNAAGDSKIHSCSIDIGLADDMTVDATMFLGISKWDKVNPCDLAPLMAEPLIDTLSQKAH